MDPHPPNPYPPPPLSAVEAPTNFKAPAPPAAATFNHPPYADMIFAAIGALKERDGSSRIAITKYIEQAYPNSLPPSHSALLTHHLKRLKSSGQLLLVKKSYKIPGPPGSDAPPLPPVDSAATSASPAQPRGRGRPPKPKPDQLQPQLVAPVFEQQSHILQQPIPIPQYSQQQQPISIPMPIPIPQMPVHIPPQPNFPSFRQPIVYHQPNYQSFPQPIAQQPSFQPFPQPVAQQQQPSPQPGTGDVPKKRPGRPHKSPASALAIVQSNGAVVKRGRGRPPGSRMSKKRPGRPPKLKTVSGVVGPNGIVKRRPGRPSKADPRSVFIPYATNVPIIGAFEEQSNGPSAVVVSPQPGSRPRGRPKKDKSAAAATGIVVPGVEQPRKLSRSGRPVGRPRKDATLAITAAPDPNVAANAELKKKLEYFQSRVGQAVGVLKPCLNNESAVDATAAVQVLEELATMDISAPLIIETPEPMLQS